MVGKLKSKPISFIKSGLNYWIKNVEKDYISPKLSSGLLLHFVSYTYMYLYI